MRYIKTILILFPVLFFANCKDEAEPKKDLVKYEVEVEPAGASITYENDSGGTSQTDISSNSWTKEFEASPDTYVYLSAQAENEDANITVTIYYEGDTFKESSSSGDFVIATASGTL